MKIYTKTGDGGETGLLGATRVSKADLRIECLGTIDELNAQLGYLRTQMPVDCPTDLASETGLLLAVQRHLFEVGAAVADLRRPPTLLQLDAAIVELESSIDRLTDQLAPLTSFILPGGTPSGALAHVTRAVCRRAERLVVALGHRMGVGVDGSELPGRGGDDARENRAENGLVGAQDRSGQSESSSAVNLGASRIYLNRLSDWLFTLARWLNQVQGKVEAPWPG